MDEYTRHVGEDHRKCFGQFFTPPDVARFMVRWVLKSGKPSVFDPAFGLGAFFDQMPKGSEANFSALEIDPEIVRFWKRTRRRCDDFPSLGDYFRIWGERHENIVCNPPYMRFQKFLDRDAVFRAFREHLKIRLSGYTNIASAFLLKSISELKGSGRLAYIMPLEFLNTGYGRLVKQKLLSDSHLFAIIALNCEKEVFPDATTSAGIVLYDKTAIHPSVRFYRLSSIGQLETFERLSPISRVGVHDLKPEDKWLPFLQERKFTVDRSAMIRLEFYGRFSRGIATGANEFFVLRPSAAKRIGIDGETECLPCIARSSQVVEPFFDNEDFARLEKDDKPVLLFSVNGSPSKAAKSYIEYGARKKYDKRFLTKSRTPWYKTEKRVPSPLWLGVFSRGGYKIVLNKSKAIHLTCFHGFQPNLFGIDHIDNLFLYFGSETGRKIVSLSVRTYGDSLDKFEPNDLNSCLVPSTDFFASLPRNDVTRAIEWVRKNREIPKWVDEFFEPLFQRKEATP